MSTPTHVMHSIMTSKSTLFISMCPQTTGGCPEFGKILYRQLSGYNADYVHATKSLDWFTGEYLLHIPNLNKGKKYTTLVITGCSQPCYADLVRILIKNNRGLVDSLQSIYLFATPRLSSSRKDFTRRLEQTKKPICYGNQRVDVTVQVAYAAVTPLFSRETGLDIGLPVKAIDFATLKERTYQYQGVIYVRNGDMVMRDRLESYFKSLASTNHTGNSTRCIIIAAKDADFIRQVKGFASKYNVSIDFSERVPRTYYQALLFSVHASKGIVLCDGAMTFVECGMASISVMVASILRHNREFFEMIMQKCLDSDSLSQSGTRMARYLIGLDKNPPQAMPEGDHTSVAKFLQSMFKMAHAEYDRHRRKAVLGARYRTNQSDLLTLVGDKRKSGPPIALPAPEAGDSSKRKAKAGRILPGD